MSTQTVTLELPSSIFQSVSNIAHATKRPVADIVRESLTNTLPPLDDLTETEVVEFARMSAMSDEDLWKISKAQLSSSQQQELTELLEAHNFGKELDMGQLAKKEALMDKYGQLLVQKSHARLLLARRGYRIASHA